MITEILIAFVAGSTPGPQSPGWVQQEVLRTLGENSQRRPGRSEKGKKERLENMTRPLGRVRYDQDQHPVVQDPIRFAKPRSDFEEPGSWSPAPAGEVRHNGVTVRPLDRASSLPARSVGASPLDDVFAAVGTPAALARLQGISVGMRLLLRDTDGAVVATRDIAHDADLVYPRRDRIMLSDTVTYGRLDGAVFALQGGSLWPRRRRDAAVDLEIYGMLLRTPWCFVDARAYTLFPAERADRDGEERVRIRISKRSRTGAKGAEDRLELLCARATMEPFELVATFADTGVVRRVFLDDWRELPGTGVRIPFRRRIANADGIVLMELEVRHLDYGQRFAEEHFRPNGR